VSGLQVNAKNLLQFHEVLKKRELLIDGLLNGIAWRDDRQVVKIKADMIVFKGTRERVEVVVRTVNKSNMA